MGKRKQTHAYEDQYGEHKSQDRQEHFGFSKGELATGLARERCCTTH
jgi:hypothetical protein